MDAWSSCPIPCSFSSLFADHFPLSLCNQPCYTTTCNTAASIHTSVISMLIPPLNACCLSKLRPAAHNSWFVTPTAISLLKLAQLLYVTSNHCMEHDIPCCCCFLCNDLVGFHPTCWEYDWRILYAGCIRQQPTAVTRFIRPPARHQFICLQSYVYYNCSVCTAMLPCAKQAPRCLNFLTSPFSAINVTA